MAQLVHSSRLSSSPAARSGRHQPPRQNLTTNSTADQPLRTERDSLGEHRVPAGAYYGIQTQRALENFPISGLRAEPSLITAYGWIKWSAAQANQELGLLPARISRVITRAAREMAEHKLDSWLLVDAFQAGAGVSFHMNVNEVIANRAAELLGQPLGVYAVVHPNDHVNYGQSTNDTFPTALRIAARLELDELIPALRSCSHALKVKGEEFDAILKAGRTHLQDAVPIRLGQEFAAYGVTLERAAEALEQAGEDLLELGLGGSAVGTGLNTHPRYARLVCRYLCRATGHEWLPAEDMRAAMQSLFPVMGISGRLRDTALELIRISNDLRLLSSGPATGLNEISLPALQPGSSIMPGKVNPVMPEMLAMVCFQVIGNDTAAAMASQAGQLELNVMMPAVAHAVLGASRILTAALKVFTTRCVEGITANEQRCRYYASSTLAQATALNPYLGYALTAQLVKEAQKTGTPLLELVESKQLLPAATLRALLDPAAMTQPRRPRRRNSGSQARHR